MKEEVMRTILNVVALSFALLAGGVSAQTSPKAISQLSDLAALQMQDQADRKQVPALPMDEITKRDAQRRATVMALLGEGRIKSADDYYAAAMILQHGESVPDARLAYALSVIAFRLAPESKDKGWLSAAAWDRLLMRQAQAQWFGTQYVPSADGKAWILYRFDPTIIPDSERESVGIDRAAQIEPSFPRIQRPSN